MMRQSSIAYTHPKPKLFNYIITVVSNKHVLCLCKYQTSVPTYNFKYICSYQIILIANAISRPLIISVCNLLIFIIWNQ